MSNPSPLPWVVEDGGECVRAYPKDPECLDCEAEGLTICTLDDTMNAAAMKANAALIVNAVNAHSALVEALDEAYREHRAAMVHHSNDGLCDDCRSWKAALLLAEGGGK